jgi:pSer/pThr/pTyr-binding forkhead associated (FHA) protein
MLVKLRVMQGAQAGREVIIPVAEFLIGRGEECHLRPRSDAISRRHCVIAVNDKQVVLRDLGSKNGSYVNGQRVEGSRVVQPGDQLQVGPLQFEIVIEHALGGSKRPAARDVKEVAARTAASTNDNEDLDIANWLETDDDTDVSRAVATPETRQFRIDDTANVMNLETHVDRQAGDHSEEQAEDVSSEEEDDDDSADEESADGKKKKKRLGNRWKKNSPGKLPPRQQSQTKDSREAAADMLKRFFNRS